MTDREAWTWLTTNMPGEVRTALDRFVSRNPHMDGAQWWDVLAMLRDSDSHLGITEPMVEEMPEWDVLRSFITLTLCYADRHFYEGMTTKMRVTVVRATIKNNGGVPA